MKRSYALNDMLWSVSDDHFLFGIGYRNIDLIYISRITRARSLLHKNHMRIMPPPGHDTNYSGIYFVLIYTLLITNINISNSVEFQPKVTSTLPDAYRSLTIEQWVKYEGKHMNENKRTCNKKCNTV